MKSIKELETQISRLSPEKLAEFREWFTTFDAEHWDRQFESDVNAGKLDAFVKDAIAEYKYGKAREL